MVNLTKRVGGRFRPVVEAANGRVKPDWVVVGGVEQRVPGGNYYIEWRERGKRRRLSVGPNAQDALARKLAKEAELLAKDRGLTVQSPFEANGRRTIAGAVAKYLTEIEYTKKRRTHQAYTVALTYFQESCPKQFVEDIERHDLLKFASFLRTAKKQGPRSVWNKFSSVLGFLNTVGVKGLLQKNDWPRFTDSEPEVYEQEELKALFAACDAEERLWYEFFLMTGMRDQEVMHVCWKDVNFTAQTVRVSHKPEFNWTPKAYKEREIPVPAKLLESLKAHKRVPGCQLVFPTRGCEPNYHFLEMLKAVAKRAGLDADNFWLHKFRATFATRHLWNGVDLRTVQAWMGHTDLESTTRYLKDQRGPLVRAKVESTFT